MQSKLCTREMHPKSYSALQYLELLHTAVPRATPHCSTQVVWQWQELLPRLHRSRAAHGSCAAHRSCAAHGSWPWRPGTTATMTRYYKVRCKPVARAIRPCSHRAIQARGCTAWVIASIAPLDGVAAPVGHHHTSDALPIALGLELDLCLRLRFTMRCVHNHQ